MNDFSKEDSNGYVIVKSYFFEDEQVVAKAVGWKEMKDKIDTLQKIDPNSQYEAFLEEMWNYE